MRNLSIGEIDTVGGGVYYSMGHAIGGAYENCLPLSTMASAIPGWGFLRILS